MTSFFLLALAAFAAALGQGATGFGFGVLSAPVLVLMMPPTAAVQVIAALSLAMSLVLVPELLRHLDRRLMIRLVIGSAGGWPMGLVLHELAGDALLQVLVGLTSSMLALLLLTLGPRATLHPSGRGRILATGAASGAMTTALAMPGPAVLAVMLLEGRSGEDVRSTLLALFTASYAVALALHAITPGIASSTWRTAAWLAAPTLAGALAGRLLRHHLDPRLSRHIVLALLLTGGLAATAKGISG